MEVRKAMTASSKQISVSPVVRVSVRVAVIVESSFLKGKFDFLRWGLGFLIEEEFEFEGV